MPPQSTEPNVATAEAKTATPGPYRVGEMFDADRLRGYGPLFLVETVEDDVEAGGAHVGFFFREADARAAAAVPDLHASLTLNAIDARAAINLWRTRKHGTDPTPAILGILEILARIEKRSDASIAQPAVA